MAVGGLLCPVGSRWLAQGKSLDFLALGKHIGTLAASKHSTLDGVEAGW
jgi:hypothetical protein